MKRKTKEMRRKTLFLSAIIAAAKNNSEHKINVNKKGKSFCIIFHNNTMVLL